MTLQTPGFKGKEIPPIPQGADAIRIDIRKRRTEQNDQPEPLPDGLPPVEPFNFDMLPETLRGWVEDIATTMQVPPDFPAVTALAALGSVLGRKIGVRPEQQTGWTEVCNFWALIVARPGALKTPSVDAALAPLKRLSSQALEEFNKAHAQQKREVEIAKVRAETARARAKSALKKHPDADLSTFFEAEEAEEITLRRYITSDPTAASLGALLIQNPNGILVHRDEIVPFLASFDREDNVEARGLYLTGWGGNSSITTDRIGRGLNLHIPAACISLLGTTQPGKIASYVAGAVRGGASDDGLIQRFSLLVWPDMSPDWKDVDCPLSDLKKRRAFEAFRRLDKLNWRDVGARQDIGYDGEPDGIPYLRFDQAAHARFLEWRTRLERRLRSQQEHPAMESHLGKYRKLVPTLALLSHLADGKGGPIGEDAVKRALAWARYLESHARRAYRSVMMPEIDAAKAILQKLASGELAAPDPNGKRAFTMRDITRPAWSRLSDRERVQQGLDMLVEYRWLDISRPKTGGRPTTVYALRTALLNGPAA